MEAKDLSELINTYNSCKKELFDHCADLFISKVRNELEEIYNHGDWTRMVDITQLGISLTRLSENFQEFEFDILSGYPMRFGETIHNEFGFRTFQKFIKSKEYEDFELNGFQGKDILQIKPFYKALKRKGLECYVDMENRQLVVALNIK